MDTMTSWMIRAAAEEDWGAVSRLLSQSSLPLDGAKEHLSQFLLAFTTDGEIAGCAGLEFYGDTALLRSVAVVPSMRGRGLGQELVRGVLQEARQGGATGVVLLTTTAAAFFTRFGFRPMAREDVPEPVRASAEFSGACPASAVTLWRDLTEPPTQAGR